MTCVSVGLEACVVSPLKISRHCDLSVDQGLHDPADHLVQRAGHVLVQLSLKAPLHLLPEREVKKKQMWLKS